MATEKYLAYLRSEKWKEIREHVLARDGRACTKCGSRFRLEIHHASYNSLYHEESNNYVDLTTLCRDCHQQETDEANHITLAELYQRVLKMGT